MAYKQGRPIHFTPKGQLKVESYPLDHVFTDEDLQAVTPLDVAIGSASLLTTKKHLIEMIDHSTVQEILFYTTRSIVVLHAKYTSFMG